MVSYIYIYLDLVQYSICSLTVTNDLVYGQVILTFFLHAFSATSVFASFKQPLEVL